MAEKQVTLLSKANFDKEKAKTEKEISDINKRLESAIFFDSEGYINIGGGDTDEN